MLPRAVIAVRLARKAHTILSRCGELLLRSVAEDGEALGCQGRGHGVLKPSGNAVDGAAGIPRHGLAGPVTVGRAALYIYIDVCLVWVGPAGGLCVAAGVAEGEVEGSRLNSAAHLSSVDPVLHGGGIAIPVFAHRVLHSAVGIVHSYIRCAIALHHVVAEARVAQVFEQGLGICLAYVLHVGALMVEVAHTAPVFSRVCVCTEAYTFLGGLSLGSTAVVIAAHVGRCHLVGHAVVGFRREAKPSADALAVVDNHISNGSESVALEGVDHRAQLFLVTEGAGVVGTAWEPVAIVVAHRLAVAVAALRYPDEVVDGSQVLGLLLKCGPLRVAVGVPVETLQHHAAIVGWPALCHHRGSKAKGAAE